MMFDAFLTPLSSSDFKSYWKNLVYMYLKCLSIYLSNYNYVNIISCFVFVTVFNSSCYLIFSVVSLGLQNVPFIISGCLVQTLFV